MTVTDTRITRYEDGDFYVDIVESRIDFEAWLCRKDYGVAEMLIACPKEQPNGIDVDYFAFVSMVESTLATDELDYDAKYGEDS